MGLFALRPALLQSQLIGPWAHLACLPSDYWHAGFSQSLLGRLFSGLSKGISLPENVMAFLESALLLGTMLLLVTLTFLDTGPNGALTWALFALACLIQAARGFSLFRQINVIDVFVVLFLLSAVVSTAFSSFFATSVMGLAKMTTFAAGYWAFRTVLSGPGLLGVRPLILLLGGILTLGVLETLIGFYQYINHIQPLATWEDPSINPELKMNRIFGTLKPSNPNLLAGFLIPAIASGLGLSMVSLTRQAWFSSFLLFGLSLLVLVGLVLTGSRGGFLAIALMTVTGFLLLGHMIWHDVTLKAYGKLKTLWLLALVSVLGLVGLAIAVSPSLQHRVMSIFAMREDSSNAYRMNVYGSAFRMFLENPWVGIGPGNGTFKLVYGLYMVPGFNALGAYSVPLEIAVEQGIVGLLMFVGMAGTLKLRTLLAIESSKPLSERFLVLFLFVAIVGSLGYGLFDTIWYRPSVNLVFWMLVAALGMHTEPLLEGLIGKSPSTRSVERLS